MRKEIIGNHTLYLGDCREILPTLSRIDAVVTDPPYGLGKRMQGGTWAKNSDHYKDMHTWDLRANQAWVDDIICLRKPSIIFGGNYYAVPPSRCWLSWCKTQMLPTMADFELAWTNLDRPGKMFFSIRTPDGEKEHPTQKPVALMEWCLSFLPNSEIILDPFMGSGTTGVACENLDRKFIGIEIGEKYFDIACKRVEAACKNLKLNIPKPTQQLQEAFI